MTQPDFPEYEVLQATESNRRNNISSPNKRDNLEMNPCTGVDRLRGGNVCVRVTFRSGPISIIFEMEMTSVRKVRKLFCRIQGRVLTERAAEEGFRNVIVEGGWERKAH